LDFCIVRIDEAETVPNTREAKRSDRDASKAALLGKAGQSGESPTAARPRVARAWGVWTGSGKQC
jgi:hypothetical protein